MNRIDEFLQMRDENSTNSLLELISDIGNTKNMSMIEIGSYIGESTLIFSEHFKSVLSIDPFINDYDIKDAATRYKDFNDVYMEFIKNISSKNNISHIKATSDEAIHLINPIYDFVYIDGLHTYEQVYRDILNYKKLIKPNGFIGGHDYHPEGWPGVVKAVEETIGVDKIYNDGSWIKKL
jgi:predicted O-methyltransferase YrrM